MQLRSFLYSYQYSSFSKASKELGITQPAITKNIHALEELFNVKLFNRDTRNFLPTKACQQLYPIVEKLCTQINTMEGVLEVIHSGSYGEVVIGFDKVFSPYASKLMMELFSDQFPNMKLTIVDDPRTQ